MAEVFSFMVWDNKLGGHVLQPRKSALARIQAIEGAEVIEGLCEEVPDDELDEDGKHAPHAYPVEGSQTIAPQISPNPAMLAMSRVFRQAAEREQGADQEYLRNLAKLAALEASRPPSTKEASDEALTGQS